MARLKITFTDTIGDLRHPGTAGFSDLVWGFARELARRGHQVRIVGLYPSGFEVDEGDVKITAVCPSQRRNIITYIWDFARVARSASSCDSDVIHTMDCVTAGMLCALPAHRRTTYHGNMNVKSHRRRLPKSPWSRSMYALMRLTTAIACRRATRLISLGPSLNDDWINAGVNPDRIAVLPNPIELAEPSSRHPQSDLLLYVGRFSREKGGVLELVRALALLPESVQLIVAGDGPLRSDVEALIESLKIGPRVELLGLQTPSAVKNLYACATLVVLPSANEMLPRVMLEAWNAGVAYAGTPVGAVPDYLHDGENGYVIPTNDPADIARTIRRALHDPEGRKHVEAHARLSVQEMDLRKVTARLISCVYEPIVAAHGALSAHELSPVEHPSELVNRVHK